ncbi:CYFA0S19e00518g1_1 [Cyberlindnera fabianii]|uniref:Trafficking protein particle complex subunit n=1 Tax=Cyberlindnera fabianii TaxID=36022 RepID=A0A061BCI5_CYBFA|nr:CYFA0S19e00518g1_1 [Cyberlindnera fabianii]
MTIFSLYIINKSGGLIYQHDLSPGLAKITSNDALILAGTIHGVFAIASKITPTALKVSKTSGQSNTLYSRSNGGAISSNTSGLRSVETEKFSMYIFQTLTGLKFLLVTSPGGINASSNDINKGSEYAENVLSGVYSLYSDYVMKNPFYEVEMPIRLDLFDKKIVELVNKLG